MREQGTGLLRSIHRHAVYPLVVRARGEGAVFRRLGELRAIERLPADRLAERQDRRLAAILEHAARRSPYYRARCRELRDVDARFARERLADLPFVTKADVQHSFREMLAVPGPRRVTAKVTGGSTGQAVTVVKNRSAIAAEMAASWLGYGWFGVRIGDRAVRFWGQPDSWKRRLRFAAADFAMHRIRFSAFAFDDADLERYWRRCLAFRPDYFYGYVSMLEAFARFLERTGRDGARLGLKVVITTSEVLSPPQRELLARVFRAPVQNEYGCGEVGPIAYECESGRLHLMSENQLVEILTPDGRPAAPGESGDIVVSDLNNYAMPLIRYRVGDLGVFGEPCPCGRGFPVLDRVWGREYDFVQDRVGRRYHGEFFMYLFEDLRSRGHGVDQFRVTQRDVDALDVDVVTHAPLSDAVRRALLGEFARRLPGMRVGLRRVDALPRRPSGKAVVVENLWLKADREPPVPA